MEPASIGHNQPPEPTPLEAFTAHVDDLMMEAKNWLDGGQVDSEELAEGVAKLLALARSTEKDADKARVEEGEPHRKRWLEVNASWAPLADRLKMIQSTAKASLKPWLDKKEADAKAEAARLQAEAAEKAQAASAAVFAAAKGTDLEAIEEAEALLKDAKRTAKAATRAGSSRATVGGGGRAVSIRRVKKARIVNLTEAARHYWSTDRDALQNLIQQLADRDAREGIAKIPGCEVYNEETVT